MKFVDVSALADSTPSTSSSTDFSDVTKLKVEEAEVDYSTLNLNHFLLDGSKTIIDPEDLDVAFWSSAHSGSDCKFETNPVIIISFTSIHTSAGITIDFIGNWADEVKITWYSSTNKEIANKTFECDSLNCFCKQQVSNYQKIKIEILSTRFPYEYVRISNITYGMLLVWDSSKIKNAKVLEQVKSTSTELAINTANIDILDENNDFDIGNDVGAWRSVQKTQEVKLTEYIDGVAVNMGTFFLDDKSFSKNIASFKLVDAIGLMANYTYYHGQIYSNKKAGDILKDIFATANITKYTIDTDVYNTELTGWLGVQSCRDALKMVCFACGAIADDSRSDTIKVVLVSKSVTSSVPIDRKFTGKTSIKLDTYVSGVNIECTKYSLESTTSEIYNDNLASGLNRITFTEPYLKSSISVTGGSVYEVDTNYVVVNSSGGNVKITGQKYANTSFSYELNKTVDANEAENVVKLGKCTLVNTTLLPTIAKKILDYYALRKVVKMNYILETEHSGNWINILDANLNQSTTLVESQNIDLAGGFISTATCRGYSTVITELYYTGNEELYAGDIGII